MSKSDSTDKKLEPKKEDKEVPAPEIPQRNRGTAGSKRITYLP